MGASDEDLERAFAEYAERAKLIEALTLVQLALVGEANPVHTSWSMDCGHDTFTAHL